MLTGIIPDYRLETFYKANPDFDILGCQLGSPAQLATLHWQGANQAETVDLLKKYQRLLRLYPDPQVAMALLGDTDATRALKAPTEDEFMELHSAQAIAARPRKQFIQEYGPVVGGAAVAEQIHQKATAVTTRTMHLWANIQNLVASPHFRTMQVNNTSPDLSQFADIPDYQDFFGSLDYCECDECRSIFGPAAYFVDFMRIVDQYITTPNQTTILPQFTLNKRRPDLATIALTCENTNDLVPYLDIVNTVLESWTASFLNVPTPPQSDVVYSTLATTIYPFTLPFNRPLEEIRNSLAALQTDLTTIYTTFNAPTEAGARESLGLSPEEWTLIITSDTDPNYLSTVYGVKITSSDLGGLNQQEVFLKQTGLTRQELGDLLRQNLSSAELKTGSIPHSFYINQKLSNQNYLQLAQDGTDTILNLDLPTLDRLQRFIRLAHKLTWSFADLDWVIRSFQAQEITADALQSIAQIKQLQVRLSLPLPILSSFWFDIKTIGVGSSSTSEALFDQIFNNPLWLKGRAPYHPSYAKTPSAPFINPLYTDSVLQIATANNSQVAGDLNLNLNDLTALITAENAQTTDLTVANLSLLYRHTRLAVLLQLPIDQYLLLLHLTNKLQSLFSTADLLSLLDLADWIKQTGFTVYELDYILDNHTSPYVTTRYRADDLPAFLQNLLAAGSNPPPVLALDDILDWPTFLNGLLTNNNQPSPSQRIWTLLSSALQQAITRAVNNKTELADQDKADLISALDTMLQRTDFYQKEDFAQLTLPAQVSRLLQTNKILSLNEIQKLNYLLVIAAYPLAIQQGNIAQFNDEWKEKLLQQLATFVGSSQDTVAALMEIVAQSIPSQLLAGLHSYIEAFLNQPQNQDYITVALDLLSRWLVLVDKIQLTSAEIESLRTYPACYGFSPDFLPITLANLQNLTTLQSLTRAFQDTQNSLIQYLAAAQTSTPSLPILAEITGWPEQEIQAAATTTFKNTPHLLDSSAGLATLQKAFDLNNALGIDIAFSNQLLLLATATARDNWDLYTTADTQLTSTIKARYSADEWSGISAKIAGPNNEARRDALASYVQAQLNLKNLRALSEYLLIDVETSGTASISLIKQGLLSLQMYLQRCRLNLEPGVTRVDIHETWWEWIMNYRVWEANRKVFLYPENFLDPGLRSDRSEAFKQLQSDLLQADITQELAQSAYQNYFEASAELANLQIVESYRCFVPQPDEAPSVETLFLFGRTASEPTTYYYRSYLNPTSTTTAPSWTPWAKIDINIAAGEITPVFAFQKLFIFWVERQTTTSSVVTNPRTTIDKATIKYTLQNFSGTWVQPQTLVKDLVLNVTPNPVKLGGYNFDLDLKKPFWQHVFATTITDAAQEKILILFGDLLEVKSQPSLSPSTSADPDIDRFEQQIADALTQNALAYANKYQGYSSHLPAITLSSDATTESTFVLFPQTERTPAGTNNGGIATFLGMIDGTNFSEQFAGNVLFTTYIHKVTERIPFSPAPDHLLNYWPLDEGSGSTIRDKSGNQLAVFQPSPSWTVVTDFPGVPSRPVIQFTHGLICSLPYTIWEDDGATGATISFWTWKTSDSDAVFLLAPPDPASSPIPLEISVKQGILTFWCGLDVNNQNLSMLKVKLPPQDLNSWSHWAFTKDFQQGIISIYYNGELLAQQSNLPVSELTILQSVEFAGGYQGYLANLSIWNVALNQEQVQADMQTISLLQNLSSQQAQARTVKNQPDWSLLNTGDEAFLVIPQLPPLKPISESLDIKSAGDDVLDISYTDTYHTPPPAPNFSFTRLTTSTIRQLSQQILLGGLDQLLTLDSQVTKEPDFARFQPAQAVLPPATNILDFHGPYGLYFQEIFFYIPFLVANTLNTNQHFSEAQQWYHYIFNPAQRPQLTGYWPLHEQSGPTVHDLVGQQNGTANGTLNWQTVTDFPGSSSRSVIQFGTNTTTISLPPASIPQDNEITLSFWAFGDSSLPNTSDGSCILAAESANMAAKSLNIYLPWKDSVVYFDFGETGGNVDSISAPVSPQVFKGVWSHWTFVKNTTSGVMKIYLNGQLLASAGGDTHALPPLTQVILGGNIDQKTQIYAGKVADLRIWNVALSDAAVIANANEQPLDRFWRYLPFRGNTLQKLVDILQDERAIQVYDDDPFDPAAIANLRIGAYQKAVVMKYIDNLLDWGDSLFTQDSWEAVSQATMLYLLAYDLLGPRPANVGECPEPAPATFADIKKYYNGKEIPQFLIELEQQITSATPSSLVSPPFNALSAYFGVNENEQFIAYWDRVEDRLYKIRHSENIEGMVRQLALFEPPLNPADLVRAVASGNTPQNVLNGISAAIAPYRFAYLLERARNFTTTLIELGSTLLNALEKKDETQLTLLKATQEAALLQILKTMKVKQRDEASQNLTALQQSLTAANHRVDYYQGLLNRGLSDHEQDAQNLLIASLVPQALAVALNEIAAPLFAIPNIFGLADGGQQIGMIPSSMAGAYEGLAATLNQGSSLAATMAQYQRRTEEWQQQLQVAQDEAIVLNVQITATQISLEIAQADLAVHQKSIAQANEVEAFLQRKFSNQDLYQWMVSRLSGLYFQTFKLALEMALAVQKTYQYELNQNDTFIDFSYWDSLRQGLLAGEGLLFGLNQLEKAYLEGNTRRLEIEKTISLCQLDPQALRTLKNTGKCQFALAEQLFDRDFPGHYCRKIKTIALSIPAVVGPYQNINATLTQLSDKILLKPDPKALSYLSSGSQAGSNGTNTPPDQTTLRQNWWRNQKIALSRGINDTGMFELNFQDERYLPFEGTGAVSTWELSLPKETNMFDFATLSDVIIQLSYTALDAGDSSFTQAVLGTLSPYKCTYYLNLKQSFAGAWQTFLAQAQASNTQQLRFSIPKQILPFNLQNVTLTGVTLYLDTSKEAITTTNQFISLQIEKEDAKPFSSLEENQASLGVSLPADQFIGNWLISIDLTNTPKALLNNGLLDPALLQNIECILFYEGEITVSL